MRKVPFTSLTNVKTFYEYMLSELILMRISLFMVLIQLMLQFHSEFLVGDQNVINEILSELLLQEAEE